VNNVPNIEALRYSARIEHDKPTINFNIHGSAFNKLSRWQLNTHCSLQC
jgi:hypothetical protein